MQHWGAEFVSMHVQQPEDTQHGWDRIELEHAIRVGPGRDPEIEPYIQGEQTHIQGERPTRGLSHAQIEARHGQEGATGIH